MDRLLRMSQEEHQQFIQAKEHAHTRYSAQREIYNPYFQERIVLNSDGFHHLRFSARRERNKREQLLKFRLLSFAFEVIRKSGTIQEYRKMLTPIGKRSKNDSSIPMKEVEYWAFIAIVGTRPIKIRVIVRRIGTGNITFWSVMPHVKVTNGKQKLAGEDIEDT
jgi:hypothetical protein